MWRLSRTGIWQINLCQTAPTISALLGESHKCGGSRPRAMARCQREIPELTSRVVPEFQRTTIVACHLFKHWATR